ncbi:MAG: family 1 encapsulin nanocompartment shell protein [Bacillota bacterium]
MVDILNRSLAPIPAEAWEFFDDEAREILNLRLNGRKVVNFVGPLGLETSSVNTGRSSKISVKGAAEGAAFLNRNSLSLIEVELPVQMERAEVEAFARGAEDADSDPIREAAKELAKIENKAIFFGMPEADIEGIIPLAKEEHDPIKIEDNRSSFFSAVFKAKEKLYETGIEGPYHLLLGKKHYDMLNELESACYPLFKKIEGLLGTEIIYVPELEDAGVLMPAGDDFELFVGHDISLGYKDHSVNKLNLFFFESFTFRVNTPEAAVVFE